MSCFAFFTFAEETDFTSQTVMLTFSSSGSQTVMIQLLDDTVLEDREYFTLQLFSTDSRVDLQQSTATVWIMDDDSKHKQQYPSNICYSTGSN